MVERVSLLAVRKAKVMAGTKGGNVRTLTALVALKAPIPFIRNLPPTAMLVGPQDGSNRQS